MSLTLSLLANGIPAAPVPVVRVTTNQYSSMNFSYQLNDRKDADTAKALTDQMYRALENPKKIDVKKFNDGADELRKLTKDNGFSIVLNKENHFKGAVFSETYNQKGNLDKGIDFTNCTIKSATKNPVSFEGAKLWSPRFNNANLVGANFSKTEINGSEFEGANLSNVNFAGAEVNGGYFIGADLTNANITNTSFGMTCFQGAKLLTPSLNKAKMNNAEYNKATKFPGSIPPGMLLRQLRAN